MMWVVMQIEEVVHNGGPVRVSHGPVAVCETKEDALDVTRQRLDEYTDSAAVAFIPRRSWYVVPVWSKP